MDEATFHLLQGTGTDEAALDGRRVRAFYNELTGKEMSMSAAVHLTQVWMIDGLDDEEDDEDEDESEEDDDDELG